MKRKVWKAWMVVDKHGRAYKDYMGAPELFEFRRQCETMEGDRIIRVEIKEIK